MSPSSRSSSWVLSFSRRTIYIKRMGSSLHEHVTVLPSPIEGLGLIAIDAISQGEQVAQFDDEGAIMTDDEFEKFRQSTNDDFDAIALGNGLHRVSKCTRDYQPINYGNHSCSPNAKLNDLGLVTIRDIEPGEEITSQ